MTYSLEEIKQDLIDMESYRFYMKYIVRSENWYFKKILEIPDDKMISINDDFKQIISSNIGVSFNSVTMVGSGKVGYSLASYKLFKGFEEKSDLDIAIISSELFHGFWKMLRSSYKHYLRSYYLDIFQGIYRGYINDKNIEKIKGCREEWKSISITATARLKSKLFFQNEISYRLYRSWEDFEEYNICSIEESKRKVTE